VARGRPKWKRWIDGQRIAAALFSGLDDLSPPLAAAFKYHSRQGPPSAPTFASVTEHDLKIGQAPYRKLYEDFGTTRVDLPDPSVEPFKTVATTWVYKGGVVHGHTVRMVERSTGTLVSSYDAGGRFRWAHAYAFPLPQRVVETVDYAAVIPASEHNYYHLVINYLLPFAHALLRHRREFEGRKIVLAVRTAPSVVVRVVEALNLLGFDVRIVKLGLFDCLYADAAIYPSLYHSRTHPNHGHWSGPQDAELLDALEKVVPALTTPAKVHIQRTDTTVRRIVNNDEYLRCVADNGFTDLEAKWSNFDLQFRMLRQAREVLSVHGAGMTNVCWTPEGTRVTEITPHNARRSSMLQIGAERGADYRFFFAGPELAKQDFSLDAQQLDLMLKS